MRVAVIGKCVVECENYKNIIENCENIVENYRKMRKTMKMRECGGRPPLDTSFIHPPPTPLSSYSIIKVQ